MNKLYFFICASGMAALIGACSDTAGPATSTSAPAPLRELRVDAAEAGPHYADQPIKAALTLRPPLRKGRLDGRMLELRSGAVAATVAMDLDERSPPQQSLLFRPSGAWAPGRYLIELTLDGQMIGQRDVDIVARPEDAAPPSAGG